MHPDLQPMWMLRWDASGGAQSLHFIAFIFSKDPVHPLIACLTYALSSSLCFNALHWAGVSVRWRNGSG